MQEKALQSVRDSTVENIVFWCGWPKR